ncbi:hypothetical protein ACOMHN_061667 [Nucella lapillus]
MPYHREMSALPQGDPEGPRRQRKTKKANQDPNQPKRPQSAFFLWLNSHRESIKRDHPGISVTEVTKLAGEMWKTVDKAEWEEKSKKAKADYKVAMAEYREKAKDQSDSEDANSDTEKKKKTKKTASPRKPKKPTGKTEEKGDFKSKEFISSDESSSDSDKPLKRKSLKKEPVKRPPVKKSRPSPDAAENKSVEEESAGGSDQ